MATTIQISDDVKTTLDRMRIFQRETYNEIIMNMIEDNMRINEKTKKELDKARKEKGISHEKVKQMLGL
jgi:predicted transcriptional regulator